MYLSELAVENFRIFGSPEDKQSLLLEFDPGLNVMVGENDSGKTAVIDAVRLLLGTRSNEWYGLSSEDFHIKAGARTKSLKISAMFRGFNDAEAAALLEWLNLDIADPAKPELVLRLTLEAARKDIGERRSRREREVIVSVRAGMDADGKLLDGDARDLIRVTYLKPLRDADQELAAKRGSRLAQVLGAHPKMETQRTSDWDKASPDAAPKTLCGIMKQTDYRLRENEVVREIGKDLNDGYLKHFSLGDKPVQGQIGTGTQDFRQILERLHLALLPPDGSEDPTSRGLGINNLLFMSTELLLLGGIADPSLSLVLIEEPEAHLHPQLQARLVQYLLARCSPPKESTDPPIQAIVTSHSPNLASMVPLDHLIVLCQGQAFPMKPACTKLDASDYEYLERFLDVTKANLFFARGVLIVEGDAEQLLLPVLADLIGRSLCKHAVSIVNVGTVGLFRYARIFQRNSSPEFPVRVACVTDRDIRADASKPYLGLTPSGAPRRTESDYTPAERLQRVADCKRNDGGPVQTFVSSHWTLEFDLALYGLAREVHAAVQLSKRSQAKKTPPDQTEWDNIVKAANAECDKWRDEKKTPAEIAALVYQPLYEKDVSKPETAQYLGRILQRAKLSGLRRKLPSYLVEAIDYVTNTEAFRGPYFEGECTLKPCSDCDQVCKAATL